MFRRLNLLLIFCLVNHSGTPPVGSHLITVRGEKASSVTLSCEVENNEIINLFRQSKNILVCQNEECENKTENVQGICKEGACDIIIKDLSFRDAGKYILRFSHTNDPKEEKQQKDKTYQLHIHDKVSVKIGKELKLDVLSNADKVEHQNETSTEWMKVWTRSKGVQSDRMTDTDGYLTINNFTARDAGSYRVLDSDGETLITVTVTESSTESKEKLDKTDGTEQLSVWVWILIGVGVLVVLVLIAFTVKKIHQRLNWNKQRSSYQDCPTAINCTGAQIT